MMANRKNKLSNEIRRAVDASAMSRYRLCKLTGIHEAAMSRFMAGDGLLLTNLDKLADVLDLHITTGGKAKAPAKGGGKGKRKG
jgi:hypothetical protein